jgi:hypothetical protein
MTCSFCGSPIPAVGRDNIVCLRSLGEVSHFDKGVCLDEHIKTVHLGRPIEDRPDLLPMGRR